MWIRRRLWNISSAKSPFQPRRAQQGRAARQKPSTTTDIWNIRLLTGNRQEAISLRKAFPPGAGPSGASRHSGNRRRQWPGQWELT